MKSIFLALALLAFLVAAAALGAYVFREPGAQEFNIKYIPPCPFCGSLKFPPKAMIKKIENNLFCPTGVYLCEDCGNIWGHNSKEWINQHPDPNEWTALLGINISHGPSIRANYPGLRDAVHI